MEDSWEQSRVTNKVQLHSGIPEIGKMADGHVPPINCTRTCKRKHIRKAYSSRMSKVNHHIIKKGYFLASVIKKRDNRARAPFRYATRRSNNTVIGQHIQSMSLATGKYCMGTYENTEKRLKSHRPHILNVVYLGFGRCGVLSCRSKTASRCPKDRCNYNIIAASEGEGSKHLHNSLSFAQRR